MIDAAGTMKKFLKVLGVVVLLLVVAAGGAAFYLYRTANSAPDFYQTLPLSGAERLKAIESVERKVLNLQGDLDRAYARAQAGATTGTTAVEPAAATSVSFTGPELDTYFTKWLVDGGYADNLAKYMTGPRIAVQDGHVIFAGQMKEFGAVVSLRFLPVLQDDGSARLKLDGTYVGRLPVPDSTFDAFRAKTVNALSGNETALRRDATIDPKTGQASESAMILTMQRQLVELIDGREVSPLVIFVPAAGRSRVPAAVSRMSVTGDEVTLGVEVMPPDARAELLDSLEKSKSD